MNLIKLFEQANRHVISLIDQITNERWHNKTPNTEWDVRDLVNHLTSENLWLPLLFEGYTIAEVGDRFDGDVLGNKPKINAINALKKSLVVLSDTALLDKTVHLSFGDTMGQDYVKQMLIDAVIHGWDLAVSIGVSRDIDQNLVQVVTEILVYEIADWRKSGVFGPEYELSKDRPRSMQDKMLAMSGRNPDWQEN